MVVVGGGGYTFNTNRIIYEIMAYSFTYDLTKLPREFFKELAKVVDKRDLHKKISGFLENSVRKFGVDKLLGIQLEDAISIVEDLVDLQIKNLVHEEDFKKAKEKILFVPHCCRKYMDWRCKAEFDPECSSFFCNHCSTDCFANRATELAEENGYKVFILPGGSCIKKIFELINCDAVSGIACPEEIKLGISAAESKGLAVKGIPLTKNGCSNTQFNLDSLKEALT
ncbi:MAG: DUF116 domain-containing protein [archaeon]|nr:DUF116 domain-containing protein [archaeon]